MHAFFFQGDTLLLPADISDSHAAAQELLFSNPEIFNITSIDKSAIGKLITITVVSILPTVVLPLNWKAVPVRQILTMYSIGDLSIGDNGDNGNIGSLSDILRAYHILQWRKESAFCGTCGAKNSDVAEQVHRLCPSCGRLEFPRICPAVITIITDETDRILLVHNKKFREGLYSHISGFNEAGETLEETVVREIREEINIEVTDIQYVKSQPWPFPNSLMLGFKARYLSGTIKPDGDEIEDAEWFTRDNLPVIPNAGSLSRSMIDSWLDKTL